MKYQIMFSGKNKKKISSICRLMNEPREWLRLKRHGLEENPGHSDVESRNFYAPNFKEVGGAYCFWVVRPSVRPFVTLFDA